MKDKKALAVISNYSPDKMWVRGVLMKTMPVEESETYERGSIVFQESHLSFNWGVYGQCVAIRYRDLTSLRIPENTANLEIIQGDKTYIFCGDFHTKKTA